MAEPTTFAALPFHILARTPSELVLTRGTTSVLIEGDGVVPLLRDFCDQFAAGARSREDILGSVPGSRRVQAAELLDLLIDRRLLIEADPGHPFLPGLESPLEIFRWHFAGGALQVQGDLGRARVAVIGVNHITATLLPALSAAGFSDLTLVDDPFLRRPASPRSADQSQGVDPVAWIRDGLSSASIVVACSDGGSTSILREWNAICVKHSVRILPVLVRNMVGLVGPLVIPGDTACFECALRREARGSELMTDIEDLEVEAQRSGVAAFHPSMAGVVAHFAVMEIVKFLGFLPAATAGVMFDINLMRPELVSRRILKVPSCPVCSSINVMPAHCIVDVEKKR